MTNPEPLRLLEAIDAPPDLRKLKPGALPQLAAELRAFVLHSVASTGGHLLSNLGTVELAIALHYVYNTPHDRLIWDVGHQSYPHKILTGRRQQMAQLRQLDGLSGFPRRCESPYDAFGTAHSSTSISAALGMAIAARELGSSPGARSAGSSNAERRRHVAVIGDGALSGGMAFEAMNHAGVTRDIDLLVILNDNEMSISPPVGALSHYLTRLLLGRFYGTAKAITSRAFAPFPRLWQFLTKLEGHAKGLLTPGTLFEELGFDYLGPIDGHDLPVLLATLGKLRERSGLRLLHVVTRKGKGYAPAEKDPILYHGPSRFDPAKGIVQASPSPPAAAPAAASSLAPAAATVAASSLAPGAATAAASSPAPAQAPGNSPPGLQAPPRRAAKPSYTQVFSEWVCDMAALDPRLVAITPAMREGSGLVEFEQRFASRYFDVGIAEQHALTLAAGMACEGLKPVVAIYSTFLQRGYDQLIHDVALQNLPVTLAIDRAGLVGADGATHAGSFDLVYLRCVPNIAVLVPADEDECRQMLYTAFMHQGPAAVRYPRGTGPGVPLRRDLVQLPWGKAQVRRAGKTLALLAFGSMLAPALAAGEELDATVVNMRFVKPLDRALLRQMALTHHGLVTLEEGARMGGAGSAVAEALGEMGLYSPLLTLGLPDQFVDQGDVPSLLARLSLDTAGILRSISAWQAAALGPPPAENPTFSQRPKLPEPLRR